MGPASTGRYDLTVQRATVCELQGLGYEIGSEPTVNNQTVARWHSREVTANRALAACMRPLPNSGEDGEMMRLEECRAWLQPPDPLLIIAVLTIVIITMLIMIICCIIIVIMSIMVMVIL